jgi:hypothetical protein
VVQETDFLVFQMDSRVTELQCIMPLENIPSVLKNGILSNERAANLSHRSVAMQEVQERRDLKQVPRGLKLHQYANLYFHARNPMMYKRKAHVDDLCVLCVSLDVLQVEGVVLADCNASSNYVRFLPPLPPYWRFLDFDDILRRIGGTLMIRSRNIDIAPESAPKCWFLTWSSLVFSSVRGW